MIDNILPLSLQTIAVIVSIATIMWRIQTRLNDKNADAMSTIQSSLEQKIDTVEVRTERWEELRRSGDRALHERINSIESTANKEIVERLSHIEGQLKGLHNISTLMERWLVENGGKV